MNLEEFSFTSPLSLQECKARLKTLKWNSAWIHPHPALSQLDKDMYTITYASTQGKLSLTTNNERSTHITGEFRLNPNQLFLAWSFVIFCALLVFIGGNLFGAIFVMLIGCFSISHLLSNTRTQQYDFRNSSKII